MPARRDCCVSLSSYPAPALCGPGRTQHPLNVVVLECQSQRVAGVELVWHRASVRASVHACRRDARRRSATGALIRVSLNRDGLRPVPRGGGIAPPRGSSLTAFPGGLWNVLVPEQELSLIDAYWRAANYLSVGQIYLYDNPLLARAARARARQAAPARPLGHDARAQFHLRAPEPHHRRARPRHDLHRRSRPRRPGRRRQHLPRGHVQRGLSRTSRRTRRDCGGCSSSSRFRAGSRATPRPRRRARSTRAASSATRCRTPSALRSTIRTDRRLRGRRRRGGDRARSAASWHSNKFLNPAIDGAVLPILHLNGYKIADPTVLARIPVARSSKPISRLRLQAVLRRGRRPDGHAPADGGDAGDGASPRSGRSSRARTTARRGPAGR